jgi:tetratricopeptide (TPR) repeat protein
MNIDELIRLSKETDDLNRALAFANEAIELNPSSQQAWANLGWVYHRCIKQKEDDNEKWDLLQQYIALYHQGLIRHPQLHRSMAKIALQHAKPNLELVEFWRFWDLRSLNEEDFKEKIINGYRYAPLAPRIAVSLSKALIEIKDQLQIQGALPHIQKIFDYSIDEEWGDYYIARLYLSIQNHYKAKEYFQKAMRNLARKSAFWSSYAQLFPTESDDRANALATAILLKPNVSDAYKLGIYEEMTEVFLSRQSLNEAKNALDMAESIKQQAIALGEKRNPDIDHHLAKLNDALKQNENLETLEPSIDRYMPYQEMSFKAFQSSQVIEECIGWVVDEFNKADSKPLYLLAYLSSQQKSPQLQHLRTLPIPSKIFDKDLAKGTCLRLFICENAKQKENLVSFEILDQKPLWDQYPMIKAVITGVADDEKRFYLATEELENLSFFVELFDRAFQMKINADVVGKKILLGVAPQRDDLSKGDQQKKIRVLCASFFEGDVHFCKVFTGKLKLHEKGFGFLQNEIPIHIGQHLLRSKTYRDGDEIALMAILGVHQGEKKWSAVSWI